MCSRTGRKRNIVVVDLPVHIYAFIRHIGEGKSISETIRCITERYLNERSRGQRAECGEGTCMGVSREQMR